MAILFRIANENDLQSILRLYRDLNKNDPFVSADQAQVTWQKIIRNPITEVMVVESSDEIVSCCSLTIVPNLSRNLKPYGVIENVVTLSQKRQQGFATYLLRSTLTHCWKCDCYKVMLMTGSKRESTLGFYQKLGFSSESKTGFVAYP